MGAGASSSAAGRAAAMPDPLSDLLDHALPALQQAAVQLARQRQQVRRVDGRIIGTGVADFTQGNTVYPLTHEGRCFQLIDVPGIEGDEQRYAPLVREAVAKAHLVFYVNGTNKKPEKATAERIAAYLRSGTQVYAIVNLRGNADAYEFDEDRESLQHQSGARNALRQTLGVLESVLGERVLLGGHCVQGLLAFCSLAMDPDTGLTTIHPSREHDLVRQQRHCLKHFGTPRAMFEFSEIGAIAQVLHGKLQTFQQDIVESNKTKVRELLAENLEILKQLQKEHRAFMAKVDPQFETCRAAIAEALKSFERLVVAGRGNLWNEFFNELASTANEIVESHFGDNDRIQREIQRAFESRQAALAQQLRDNQGEHLAGLRQGLRQAMKRLVQDVQRFELQSLEVCEIEARELGYQPVALDMKPGLGSIALNIGSYAATGATIGSPFGGLPGAAIGAAIGAVLGALVSVMQLFVSREKRVRRAQAQVQERLEQLRGEALQELGGEVRGQLMKPLRQALRQGVLAEVDALQQRLVLPQEIVRAQIANMNKILKQLDRMPHGTLQPIRH